MDKSNRRPAQVLAAGLYPSIPYTQAFPLDKTACNQGLENKLVMVVSLGIVGLVLVSIFLCFLHLYYKRKWTGRGTKVACIHDHEENYPYGPPRTCPPQPYRETILSRIPRDQPYPENQRSLTEHEHQK